MRQRALCRKEWNRTVFLRKNADGILLMVKLESVLFVRKLHITLSANRRNLKALGIFCLTGLPMKGLFILVNFRQAGKRHENLIDRHEYFLQYRFTKNLTIIFIIIRL